MRDDPGHPSFVSYVRRPAVRRFLLGISVLCAVVVMLVNLLYCWFAMTWDGIDEANHPSAYGCVSVANTADSSAIIRRLLVAALVCSAVWLGFGIVRRSWRSTVLGILAASPALTGVLLVVLTGGGVLSAYCF